MYSSGLLWYIMKCWQKIFFSFSRKNRLFSWSALIILNTYFQQKNEQLLWASHIFYHFSNIFTERVKILTFETDKVRVKSRSKFSMIRDALTPSLPALPSAEYSQACMHTIECPRHLIWGDCGWKMRYLGLD